MKWVAAFLVIGLVGMGVVSFIPAATPYIGVMLLVTVLGFFHFLLKEAVILARWVLSWNLKNKKE